MGFHGSCTGDESKVKLYGGSLVHPRPVPRHVQRNEGAGAWYEGRDRGGPRGGGSGREGSRRCEGSIATQHTLRSREEADAGVDDVGVARVRDQDRNGPHHHCARIGRVDASAEEGRGEDASVSRSRGWGGSGK